jgi:hypothetical protein
VTQLSLGQVVDIPFERSALMADFFRFFVDDGGRTGGGARRIAEYLIGNPVLRNLHGMPVRASSCSPLPT